MHQLHPPRRYRRLAAAGGYSDHARHSVEVAAEGGSRGGRARYGGSPCGRASGRRSIACVARWHRERRCTVRECVGPDERALRQQADGDGCQRSASRVVTVAGAALARRERKDARLRGAPRDPGDAAHGAQPSGAARDLYLPRGPVPGAARHGSRPLPGSRWSKPARVHGIRRRGSKLRVLPPPGAVRPSLETIDR